jgi:hypothetical protein
MNWGPGVVVHTCNPSYSRQRFGRSWSKPGQGEARKAPSQQTCWVWWYMPVITATWEATSKRITVWSWPKAKMQDPIWKMSKAKKGSGCVSSGRVPAKHVVGPKMYNKKVMLTVHTQHGMMKTAFVIFLPKTHYPKSNRKYQIMPSWDIPQNTMKPLINTMAIRQRNKILKVLK